MAYQIIFALELKPADRRRYKKVRATMLKRLEYGTPGHHVDDDYEPTISTAGFLSFLPADFNEDDGSC